MHRTHIKRTAEMVMASLLLCSCNMAPKYQRPPTESPAAFKETPGDPAWHPADPKDSAVRTDWWKSYNDPVLNGLEDQVRVSNQTVREAEANFRTSRALVVAARASLFPSATAAASATRTRSSQTFSVSGNNPSATAGSIVNEYELPVDATYTIDLWGRVRNAVAASAYSAQASAADLATAVLTTQAELAQDYFALRAADEQRSILVETVKSYQDTLDLTKTLVRSGIDSDEDLATAQTQLDTVIAQATDAGVTRAQYEHAIAVLVGKPPAEVTIAPAPFAATVPATPPGLPSDLLERRPDIAAAERNVASANANIGIARTAYFPSLDLNATGGFETSGSSSRWFEWPSRFWSVGPQLAGTVFSVGAIRAANEEAQAQYDEAVAAYRQTVLGAFQGVEDNLAALRILAEEEGQLRTAVQSAQHYLSLTLTRYKAGIDSSLNVATAQTTVLTNREALLQVRLRGVNASISLVMALGGGWGPSDIPTFHDLVARPPKWHPASASDVPPGGPVTPANPPP